MSTNIIAENEIRAYYTESFIRVYQAYNHSIADSAIRHGRFVSPPFKLERTTWIKPSFLWMMYRCGWAIKENQERVLAIDISHEGFKWALNNACLSHFDGTFYTSEDEWRALKDASPVVVQWDPERDLHMNKLPYRSLQIGLSPKVSQLYISEWILAITDITSKVIEINSLLDENRFGDAKSLLPLEKTYLL